jgi:hypothetical protein
MLVLCEIAIRYNVRNLNRRTEESPLYLDVDAPDGVMIDIPKVEYSLIQTALRDRIEARNKMYLRKKIPPTTSYRLVSVAVDPRGENVRTI